LREVQEGLRKKRDVLSKQIDELTLQCKSQSQLQQENEHKLKQYTEKNERNRQLNHLLKIEELEVRLREAEGVRKEQQTKLENLTAGWETKLRFFNMDS